MGTPTIAVDLGGTMIKLGLVHGGALSVGEAIEARSSEGLAPQMPRISSAIKSLCEKGGVDPRRCRGIGIGVPTLIDPYAQKLAAAIGGKFADAMSVDLHGWANAEFGLPLKLENDAHAALLGEWRYGAGRGCDDLVMVTLGTGIGTSVLIRGHPLRGRHGQAGNLGGHVVVTPNGRKCGCGGRGCLETECVMAVLAEIGRADPRFSSSALSRETKFDFEAVFRLADTDELARALRDRAMAYWGAGLVSLVHAFDPTKIILGGGIMRSGAVILPALQAFVNANAWTPWGKVQLLPAQLGNDAGMVGLSVLFDETLQFI